MDAATERLTAGAEPAGVCVSPCCGRSTRPPTLSDYIERGLRRRRTRPLPIVGDVRHDDDGRFAQFSVRMSDGVIADVAFDATTCVTLVAYCEVAAEWVTGLTVRAAAHRVRLHELAGALPLVPDEKRHRAVLAVQAVMATVTETARRQLT